MDHNNGLEVRIKGEITTIITMGLGEIPPMITKTSPQDRTSDMGIIAQITEDHLTNEQISRLTGTMEIDLERAL